MVFYFSGTGNTRWAAETLARQIGERLLFIPEELHSAHRNGQGRYCYALQEGERIGFCFPTHGWQPPRLVRRFVSRLSFQTTGEPLSSHYCYALTTCGDNAGLAMEMLNRDLKACCLQAESMFSLIMPESYVCLPFMHTDTPAREREKTATARRQLAVFSTMIEQRQRGQYHIVRGTAPWLLTHVIGAFFNACMVTDRWFRADAQRCTGCRLCSRLCPTGCLTANEDGHPVWAHDHSCTCCLACYHHCPHHAIHYGSITRHRGQYYFGHH